MTNWTSVLHEFQIPEPALTGSLGEVPILEPLPKVVLFDVYGTLVCPLVGDLADQTRLVSGEDSFVATAERFGFSRNVGIKWHGWFFEAIAGEHQEMKKKGITPAEVQVDQIWVEMLARVGGDHSGAQARKVAAYREMMANPVRAFSGARAVLRALKRDGMKLGIVSNSQFYTLPILGMTLGIDPGEFFEPEMTFLSFRLGFAKPSPYFFRLVRSAVVQLACRPEEALVVGNDCENDVLAAQAHGLQALLFHGNDQSVRPGPPDWVGTTITSHESLLIACGM